MLHDLRPGTATVTQIKFDKYAVSYWREDVSSEFRGCWVAAAGVWTAHLGRSASVDDLACSQPFELLQSFTWNGV